MFIFIYIILILFITWKGLYALMFSKDIGFFILSIPSAPLSNLCLKRLDLATVSLSPQTSQEKSK